MEKSLSCEYWKDSGKIQCIVLIRASVEWWTMAPKKDRKDNKSTKRQMDCNKRNRGSIKKILRPELNDGLHYVIER